MRTFALIIIAILLLMFQVPAWAYHKWYDQKGIVHYTGADPPADAQKEDCSSWWVTEPGQDEVHVLRKQRIEQARLKIKNNNAPKPGPDIKPAQDSHEDISPETEAQAPDEESESIENKGLFKRWVGIFFKGEVEAECKEPWLEKEHGLVAISQSTNDLWIPTCAGMTPAQ